MIRRKEEKQEGMRQEEHASAASASAGAMIPHQTRVNKGLRHLQSFASQRQMRDTVITPLALSTAAEQTRNRRGRTLIPAHLLSSLGCLS